jgi:hypothetical protein
MASPDKLITRLWLATIIIVLVLAIASFFRKNSMVYATDVVSGKTRIVGVLGSPIGTQLELTCRIEREKKNESIALNKEINGLLVVHEIGGRSVKPISIPLRFVEPIDYEDTSKFFIDSQFRCRGYEKLCYFGVPPLFSDDTELVFDSQVPSFGLTLSISRIVQTN